MTMAWETTDGEVFWSTDHGATRWVLPPPVEPAAVLADPDPADDPPPPPHVAPVHHAQPRIYPVIRQIPTSVEFRAEILFLERHSNEMLRWQTEIHLEYARRYDLPHRPPPDLPWYVPQPDPAPSQQAGPSQGRRRGREYMDDEDYHDIL